MKYNLNDLEKLQMHRLMWEWIAEGSGRSKDGWWNIYLGIIDEAYNGCFLCAIFAKHDPNCPDCPLGECIGTNRRGAYARWLDTRETQYALQIAHCADHIIAELERAA